MSAHAHSAPCNRKLRPRRHRSPLSRERQAPQAPLPLAPPARPLRAEEQTAQVQTAVKPWQVALGVLALLCSGIDLG